jgi:hypothetical protein
MLCNTQWIIGLAQYRTNMFLSRKFSAERVYLELLTLFTGVDSVFLNIAYCVSFYEFRMEVVEILLQHSS